MNRLRPSATIPLLISPLLISLCLGGCELDVDEEMYEEIEAFDPGTPLSDVPIDELSPPEGPSDEQVSLCSLGLPDRVVADANGDVTVHSTLSGVGPTRYFAYEVSNYPWFWRLNDYFAPYSHHGGSWTGLWYHIAGNNYQFTIFMDGPANVTPGTTINVDVRLHDENNLVCSHPMTILFPPNCSLAWWSENPWPSPWFDGWSCYVTSLPLGLDTFVLNRNWYYKPVDGIDECPVGVWDNANCYLGSAPQGTTPFFSNNNVYYSVWP